MKVIHNTIKCATGPAISIRGPRNANEPPTRREFKHLEIADNHAYDDRQAPRTTALIELKDNPWWAKMILRNNSAGVGVPVQTVGLTAGVWLIEDGSPPSWAGYGSPEGVIEAPVGSTDQRRDGSSGATFYVKQSGAGNIGWAPLSASPSFSAPVEWKDAMVNVRPDWVRLTCRRDCRSDRRMVDSAWNGVTGAADKIGESRVEHGRHAASATAPLRDTIGFA